MSRTLKGIQENFLDAIDINGKSGISMARQKAQEFRKTAFVLATIEGKERISKQILDEFERYYVPAENAASIMAGITPGNAYPDFEKMIVTLNTLTATLMNEDAEASKAVTKMDRLGLMILIGYLLFAIFRGWIFSHWLHGYTLTVFSLSIAAGGILGRFYSTRKKIRQLLKEKGFLYRKQ